MSKETVCDRCGKVIQESSGALSLSYRYPGDRADTPTLERDNLDICFKCSDPVLALIDKLLLAGGELASKAKKVVKPKKEHPAAPKDEKEAMPDEV